MDDSLLSMIGIKGTCKIGWDFYHLFEVDWPKHFGNIIWSKISKEMRQMVYATTEQQYMSKYGEIKQVLKHENSSHLDYLMKGDIILQNISSRKMETIMVILVPPLQRQIIRVMLP